MLRKTFLIVLLYFVAVLLAPVIQSYDFEEGMSVQYAKSWLQDYVYPEYDRSVIHQVDSAETQDVELNIGEEYQSGDSEVLGSEYSGDFIIEDDPGLFRLVLVQDGKVAGGYTNSDDVSISNINIANLDREKVRETYGEPEEYIQKGWKRLRVNEEGFEVFDLQEVYVYFFYDLHQEEKVNGMLLLDKDQIASVETLYNNPPAEDNSRLNHLIVNASRIEYGLEPLEIDGRASSAALGHSTDMAQNDYFEHESPHGATLKDRIEESGASYRKAGENIAMGHTSAIFAHHSLLNSPDHRVNILSPDFTHLGTGTAYGREDVPYYTENYIQK
ncbi:MAG TPA: CAP domain-containing protein [Candidatus Salinicoccus stercoripullorum]|uniref:CAP domain-containing protein n=1 Tax=Candidatus Salinicoccus stercoripullorum TaxID=2838756 RepID=A0A9D1QF12_9STAP|nr:CAP domain-containing protein [Candidatus Salinicoccus stercoripullorum]